MISRIATVGLVGLTLAWGSLTAPAASAADYKITILGGSAGGVWSVITEGVAESIRRGIPSAQVTTEPGKDGPNQVMVNKGEVQFAITYDATNFSGLNGIGPYKEKLAKLRTVAILDPVSAFQFIIDAKTGITSFQDIKDKKYPLKLGTNRRGTLMQLSGEKVLEAYGITYADIEKWGGKIQPVPNTQALDLWDAGQLDAAQEVAQYPASQYIEHATKHELRILSIDDDKLPQLQKELGMTPYTIPANAYPFQKEPVRTLNTNLVLLTSADQPEQLVYDVVKAMNQNIKYLNTVHANLKDLTPKAMANGPMVELHPGAAKYYREIGALP
jgi:TRAP transporter TAXI family solute receptor